MVSLHPEALLKTTVGKSMLTAAQKLQLNAAILFVVTVLILIAVCLYWIHLRGIWSHHSFAVNDYIKADLLTNVKTSLESILLLNDMSATSSYPAHELYVDDSEKVESKRVGDKLEESCEKQLYRRIEAQLPSLGSITPGSLKTYSANTLLKEVITTSSPPSSPVSKVLLEALRATGNLTNDVADTYTGLLMLLTEEDMRLIQRRGVNVGTMDKVRTYVTSLGVKRGDAAMAYIGGCVNDKNNGAANLTKTARTLSRALCGATDIINIMKNVVPQAKELYDARQKKSIPGVFWLFYRPYFEKWIESILAFFRNFLEITRSSFIIASTLEAIEKHTSDVENWIFPPGSKKATKEAKKLAEEEMAKLQGFTNKEEFTDRNVELAKDGIRDILSGKESTVYIGSDGNLHRSEGFFKAIGQALKAFAELPKLLVLLITKLPDIFIALIKILEISIKTIVEIIRLCILFLSDPMTALIRLCILLCGIPYLLLLIIARQLLVNVVVAFYAIFIALPDVLLNTVITGCIFPYCILGAVCDYFLNGVIRVLARTENHPEAWWYNSGFESHNLNRRAVFSFSTCPTGYNPKSLLCIRKGGCLNESCSAGMLMRAYRTGRYRHFMAIATGERMLPSEKKGCRKIVSFNSMKCNKALYGKNRSLNLVKLDGASIKDMVRALCLTRNHVLPGKEWEMAKLAKHATYDDPIARKLVGVVTDTTADLTSGMKTSTRLCVTAVAIVVFGLGIGNMVRLRTLTGSLVSAED